MSDPIKRPASIGQAWRELVQQSGEIKRLKAEVIDRDRKIVELEIALEVAKMEKMK